MMLASSPCTHMNTLQATRLSYKKGTSNSNGIIHRVSSLKGVLIMVILLLSSFAALPSMNASRVGINQRTLQPSPVLDPAENIRTTNGAAAANRVHKPVTIGSADPSSTDDHVTYYYDDSESDTPSEVAAAAAAKPVATVRMADGSERTLYEDSQGNRWVEVDSSDESSSGDDEIISIVSMDSSTRDGSAAGSRDVSTESEHYTFATVESADMSAQQAGTDSVVAGASEADSFIELDSTTTTPTTTSSSSSSVPVAAVTKTTTTTAATKSATKDAATAAVAGLAAGSEFPAALATQFVETTDNSTSTTGAPVISSDDISSSTGTTDDSSSTDDDSGSDVASSTASSTTTTTSSSSSDDTTTSSSTTTTTSSSDDTTTSASSTGSTSDSSTGSDDTVTNECYLDCSGNGICYNSKCYCEDLYVGAYCQTDSTCSYHGSLVDEACICNSGFAGSSCNIELSCTEDCSSQGTCVLDTATADDYFRTMRDSNKRAMHNVRASALLTTNSRIKMKSSTIVQANGTCSCDSGFDGDYCQLRTCPDDCSGGGSCNTTTGDCSCYPGYLGDACATLTNCSGNCTSGIHGVCLDSGECSCYTGWNGDACTDVSCLLDCSDAGTCMEGQCLCDDGYAGYGCQLQCDDLCSGNGLCYVNGTSAACLCEPGWEGSSCDTTITCPGTYTTINTTTSTVDNTTITTNTTTTIECNGNGDCWHATGTCFCNPYYTGDACDVVIADCSTNNCSSHGVCSHGLCYCDFGYSGTSCDQLDGCQADCNGHGLCSNKECYCYTGFTGTNCDVFVEDDTCLNNCTGNGICRYGVCWCIDDYSGLDCSISEACATQNCSMNGICRFGECFCNPGWEGTTCSDGGCDGCDLVTGRCLLGVCECLPGYTGANCTDELTCSVAANGVPCSGHGVCLAGLCKCSYGYNGTDCSTLIIASASCPNNCSGNGACYLGNCFCATGWSSQDCSTAIASSCPMACTGQLVYDDSTEIRGLCSYGTCFCYPSWSGDGCQVDVTCSDRCAYNGVCAYGTCFCSAGWSGTDCDQAITNSTEIELLYEADLAYYLADLPCGGCNGHGICVSESDGCACEPFYTGTYCSQFDGGLITTRCGSDCSDHGKCLFGKCYCDLGYIGETCDTQADLPCTNNCMGNGVCNWGHCICDNGWTGSDCGTLQPCLYDCGTHGICVNAVCECTQYYSGDACNIMDSSAMTDLDESEMSIVTFIDNKEKKLSSAGSSVAKKSLTACDLDCGTYGVCANGKCFCENGWSGSKCNQRVPSTFLKKPLNMLGSSPLGSDVATELSAASFGTDTQGTLGADGSPDVRATYPPLLIGVIAFALGVIVCATAKWAIDARNIASQQHRLKRLAMAHQQQLPSASLIP